MTEINTAHTDSHTADPTTGHTLRLGVLISGNGGNLQAILDAVDAGKLDAVVAVVISNKSDAYGLERARKAGIPHIALDSKNYPDAQAFDNAVLYELHRNKVEWVVMAGYMRLVTSRVLDAFPHKVLNIHPSKLPAFPGAHAIRDALAAKATQTGVTVHIANEVFDEGPIIMQRDVPILEGDTFETLAQRIHVIEHELYPEVLQLIAEGRVSLEPQERYSKTGKKMHSVKGHRIRVIISEGN